MAQLPPQNDQSPANKRTNSYPDPFNQGRGWFLGIILILIGAYFLFSNLTGFSVQNWWAVFILLPAFASLSNALRSYRQQGVFTREARGSLIGGLVLLFIAAVFLFDLDFGQFWPVFLILAGLAALLNGLIRN